MAINGWEKTRDNTWTHKSKRKGEGYDKYGNIYSHHEINIRRTAFGYIVLGTGEGSSVRMFKSKRDAIAFAIKYMRSH